MNSALWQVRRRWPCRREHKFTYNYNGTPLVVVFADLGRGECVIVDTYNEVTFEEFDPSHIYVLPKGTQDRCKLLVTVLAEEASMIALQNTG